jgi:hypothetical protein
VNTLQLVVKLKAVVRRVKTAEEVKEVKEAEEAEEARVKLLEPMVVSCRTVQIRKLKVR